MYSLLHHNTFGIDAWCQDFKSYTSVQQLRDYLPCLANQRWLHIGSGSNLLFVKDFQGLILHSEICDFDVIEENSEFVYIKVGSGYEWDAFVERCVYNGYYGLENLSLIPGEVGASAVQNIGAYGVEVSHFIKEVITIEVATGKQIVFSNNECHYQYRYSVFKDHLKGKYIVTHVVYRLFKKFSPILNYSAIQRELDRNGIDIDTVNAIMLRNLIIQIRQSKLPDPCELGSAGSFFVNPVVSYDKYDRLKHDYPGIPHYDVNYGVKIPAAWFIEKCGWKGRSLGPVGVYSKQALVLVNLGGATGQDIVSLSDAIRKDVSTKFGVTLHPEVIFI